jgi:hypothetical protein
MMKSREPHLGAFHFTEAIEPELPGSFGATRNWGVFSAGSSDWPELRLITPPGSGPSWCVSVLFLSNTS